MKQRLNPVRILLVTALILALVFPSFPPITRAEQKGSALDGPGFDTPEEAAEAYLLGLRDKDVDRMLSAFAIQGLARRYSLSSMLERYKGYTKNFEMLLPSIDEFTIRLNAENRRGKLILRIINQLMLYNAPTAPNDYQLIVLSDQEKRDQFLKDVGEELSVYRFTGLQVTGSVDPVEAAPLAGSENAIEQARKYFQQYGLEPGNFRNVLMTLRVNDENWLFAAQACSLDGRWYLESPGGYLSALMGMAPEASGLVPAGMEFNHLFPQDVGKAYDYLVQSDGTAQITRYRGKGAVLQVPNEFAGHPVASIADSAFEGCSTLTSVTVPAGVTSIGGYAFARCTGLREIMLPEGLLSLGEAVFTNCSSLERVSLPSSTLELGSWLFSGCISLIEVNLPPGLRELRGMTFDNCRSLKKITIPEGVLRIGGAVFFGCSSLDEVRLPPGLTSLSINVFYNCDNLKEIVIPPAVTSIEAVAFKDCTNLEEVTIPPSVASIHEDAFAGCKSLKTIYVSSGSYALEYCLINGLPYTLDEGQT